MINHRFGIHLVEIYKQMLKLKLNEGYMEVHHAFFALFLHMLENFVIIEEVLTST